MRRAILRALWTIILAGAITCVPAIPWGARADSEPFAQRVAMRCAGEARWAIAPCACVVKNRLAGGWNEAHVLDAFFAADLPATALEIDLAQRVLTGAWPCDESLWFMFSADDVALIGLDPAMAILATARGERVIYFYAKGALRDRA